MIHARRSLLLMVCVTTLLFSSCIAPITVPGATVNPATEYPEFLADQYQLTFGKTVTQAEYAAALTLLLGDTGAIAAPAEIDQPDFATLEAILLTVHMANVDELGYSYPAEKVDHALAGWSTVPSDLALARRQELAAAVDSGLIPQAWRTRALTEPVSGEVATDLLGNLLLLTGNYKDFLGRSTDPDIVNKLMYAWTSFDQVLMPELQESANALIAEGVITGYNIKRSAQRAHAASARTLIYGHSNMEHAKQLIGLLRSEGLEADIQLEPKTSAFLYLDEWGEPTQSPEFVVEPLEGGNGIAYSKEYDLVFEFDDPTDRDQFDLVIKQYAKKNEDNQPGLITGSWWQPLYSSQVELADYFPVKNNVVTGDQFYIQSFSLVEASDAVVAAFQAAYPAAEVTVTDLWVNEAFHNYLLGEPL